MTRLLALFPKIDPDGRPYVLGALVVALILGVVWWPLFLIALTPVFLSIVAFRDPDRVTFDADGIVVAPVDGRAVDIDQADPPADLRLPPGDYVRVRIQSSPFCVSTLRAPAAGQISVLEVRRGKWAHLALEADAAENGQLLLTVRGDRHCLGAVVSAGGFAPRFFPDAEAGRRVALGARLGQRIFGGWCDLFMPVQMAAQIVEGMSIIAGETVLGAEAGPAPPPGVVR
jgi:phosphatidylserine decarboxylase